MFLPLSDSLSHGVKSKVKDVIKEKKGVALRLPPGKWSAFYEQFKPPQRNMRGLYRNIVLKHGH